MKLRSFFLSFSKSDFFVRTEWLWVWPVSSWRMVVLPDTSSIADLPYVTVAPVLCEVCRSVYVSVIPELWDSCSPYAFEDCRSVYTAVTPVMCKVLCKDCEVLWVCLCFFGSDLLLSWPVCFQSPYLPFRVDMHPPQASTLYLLWLLFPTSPGNHWRPAGINWVTKFCPPLSVCLCFCAGVVACAESSWICVGMCCKITY